LVDIDVDGMVIFERIRKTYDGRFCKEFIWRRTGTSEVALWKRLWKCRRYNTRGL